MANRPTRNGRAMFMLMIFDDPNLAQYVSNDSRENMVAALREAADRLEAREDIARVTGGEKVTKPNTPSPNFTPATKPDTAITAVSSVDVGTVATAQHAVKGVRITKETVATPSGRSNLQPQSNAGKIRAALDRLGWDAPAKDVAIEVGKVFHCLGYGNPNWDAKNRRFVHVEKLYLPESYINSQRSKWLRRFWEARQPSPKKTNDNAMQSGGRPRKKDKR